MVTLSDKLDGMVDFHLPYLLLISTQLLIDPFLFQQSPSGFAGLINIVGKQLSQGKYQYLVENLGF
jgi:hypothetical protein